MHCFNDSTRAGNFIVNIILDHSSELDTKPIKLIFNR